MQKHYVTKEWKKIILWITNQKFVFKNTRKIFYGKILNKKYILNKKARRIEYIEGRKMVLVVLRKKIIYLYYMQS